MAPKESLAWDHFVGKGENKAERITQQHITSYKSY